MKSSLLKALFLVAVIAVFCSAFTVTAFAEERAVTASGTCGADGDNLTWTLYDDGELVIEGIGAMKDYGYIYDPNTGYSSFMRAPWYDHRSIITTAAVAEGVTAIGNEAFYFCSKLASIDIPAGVTSIGDNAFYNCNKLTSIEIPSSVTSIGRGAFSSCSALETFDVKEGNTAYVDAEGVLFTKDMKKLVQYPASKKGTSYKIPDAVTSIEAYAFYYCYGLTGIEIPAGVTSIGDCAFESCVNLTSIAIPSCVTSIGEDAFWNCSKLTSIEIPASVTSIGYGSFCNCSSLTSIEVADGNTVYTDVDGVLFTKDMSTIISYPEGKTATSYKIPAEVTNISRYAFWDCAALTSIEIPNGVKSIGSNAFCGCSFETVALPSGLKTINSLVFQNCFNLKSVEIPASVTSIGSNAFVRCKSLTGVTILSKMVKFEYNDVFEGCPEVLIIYGGAGTTAQTYATKNGHNFVEIDIPVSVLSSGNCGASGNNITYTLYDTGELVIEGIGAMANWGFMWDEESDAPIQLYAPWRDYRADITKVTVRPGVTAIGSEAFVSCRNLTGIDLPNTVIGIGSSAFENCPKLDAIKLPENLTQIGSYAFAYCNSLENITIPAKVQNIGSGAFRGCSSLASIDVESANAYYTYVDGVLFTKDMKTLHTYLGIGNGDSYVVPSGVTMINSSAFEYCSKLTSVTLPETLVTISSAAFWGCSGLTEITIPATVATIDFGVFYNCSSLAKVTIYSKNAYFSGMAFYACAEGLTIYGGAGSTAQTYAANNGHNFVVIDIPSVKYGACGSKLTWKLNDNGELVIEGTGSMYNWSAGKAPWYDLRYEIKKVTVSNGVTTIGSRAFYDCTAIKSIELQVGGQAVLGRQDSLTTPWLTERHGYDPTSPSATV